MTDPSTNVVVFAYERDGETAHATGEAPTTAPDSIQTVWQKVSAQHNIDPAQVNEIYSEWQPADPDRAFIQETFGQVEVSYSFDRPDDEADWEEALVEAQEIMEEALAAQQTEAPMPILRNMDGYTEFVLHQPLTDSLGLFLAHVSLTERGSIGVDYITKEDVDEADLQALWQEALTNLMSGLQVSRAQEDDGREYFLIQHEAGLAGATVGLPNFYEQAHNWTNAETILVGIHDPNTLIVGDANGSAADHIRQMIADSEYRDGAINLDPTTVIITEAGVTDG